MEKEHCISCSLCSFRSSKPEKMRLHFQEEHSSAGRTDFRTGYVNNGNNMMSSSLAHVVVPGMFPMLNIGGPSVLVPSSSLMGPRTFLSNFGGAGALPDLGNGQFGNGGSAVSGLPSLITGSKELRLPSLTNAGHGREIYTAAMLRGLSNMYSVIGGTEPARAIDTSGREPARNMYSASGSREPTQGAYSAPVMQEPAQVKFLVPENREPETDTFSAIGCVLPRLGVNSEIRSKRQDEPLLIRSNESDERLDLDRVTEMKDRQSDVRPGMRNNKSARNKPFTPEKQPCKKLKSTFVKSPWKCKKCPKGNMFRTWIRVNIPQVNFS